MDGEGEEGGPAGAAGPQRSWQGCGDHRWERGPHAGSARCVRGVAVRPRAHRARHRARRGTRAGRGGDRTCRESSSRSSRCDATSTMVARPTGRSSRRSSATPAPSTATSWPSSRSRGYLPDDVIGKEGVEASFESELRGEFGSQRVQRDASGRLVNVIETVREPRPGNQPDAHDRRGDAAARDPGTHLGHGRGRCEPGGRRGDESPDRRDPGHGLAARVRQQQVRDRHQRRGLRRLPDRSGSSAAQPRHQRHLSARVDVQARDRHRGAGGGGDHPGPAVADLWLLPDPRRSRGRVPVRLESPGLRPARHDRRLRCQLGHLLLPDGDRDRDRPAGRVGERPRVRRAVRHPTARRVGGHHREHRVGAAAGPVRRLHGRGRAGRHRAERDRRDAPPDAERLCGGRQRREPHASDDRSRRGRCSGRARSGRTSRR